MKDNMRRVEGNIYVYLANNGPSISEELPNAVKFRDLLEGVSKFHISIGGKGRKISGGDGKYRKIYYIEGKHPRKSVVDKWLDVHKKTVDEVPHWSIYVKTPKDFREEMKESLDINTPDGGNVSQGGTCLYCGETYDINLPTHIRKDCEEV